MTDLRPDERLEPDTLVKSQLADAWLLARAARSKPFYEDRIGARQEAGPPVSLRQFESLVPLTTRADISSAQERFGPFGGFLAAEQSDMARIYRYPNGHVVAWTVGDEQAQVESYRWALSTVGLERTDIVDLTFQYAWVPAGTIWDAGVRALGCTAVPGGAGAHERHVEAIRELGVTVVVGFPTFLSRIGDGLTEDSGSVRTLVMAGELLEAEDRSALSAKFGGAHIREVYGTGETGLVAAECGVPGAGMHISPRALVEVRDPVTGELAEEGQSGEVVLTALDIRDLPAMRFKTGDLTESWSSGPCACGRTTPRLGRILGRADDLLRVKGLFVGKAQIVGALADVGLSEHPFVVTVNRDNGLDVVALRVEAGAVGALAFPAEALGDAVQTRCGLSMHVEPVGHGIIEQGQAWIDDRRVGR